MSGGGSLGIRSGSYGSLDKQQLQVQTATLAATSAIASARRASKMIKEKEKERFFLWIYKFVGRKRVGMVFLCLVSAAVFFWVLFMAKGSSISPFLTPLACVWISCEKYTILVMDHIYNRLFL
ncbi:hypothetical protein Lalb_Chr16g0383791 [Lupinus albus]|uniref:Transmembrane protein n=1 Tax=Lupinus albus TaxID=3870 RepID=A0A6A4P616_LUPAL|nr:hypothetical protein Lalb_Chr16g0383791 [Lupinus albus]